MSVREAARRAAIAVETDYVTLFPGSFPAFGTPSGVHPHPQVRRRSSSSSSSSSSPASSYFLPSAGSLVTADLVSSGRGGVAVSGDYIELPVTGGGDGDDIQADETPHGETRVVAGGLSLASVYGSVFCSSLTFGMVYPVMPMYAEDLGANGFMLGVIISSYLVPNFFGTLVFGRASDALGRRRVFLLNLLGILAGNAVLCFAGEIWLLCLGRAVAGAFGGCIPVAQAYVADTSGPAERTPRMSALTIAYGLGMVLGPAAGAAVLSVWPTFFAVAYAGTAVAAVNLVAAAATMRESTATSARAAARGSRTVDVLRRSCSSRGVLTLMAANFVMYSAGFVVETVLPIFGKDHIGMNAKWLAVVFMVFGLLFAATQPVVSLVSRAAPGAEPRVAAAASLAIAASLAAVPFAGGLAALFAVIIPIAVGNGFLQPVSMSILSKEAVDQSDRGSVTGAVQSCASLGAAVSPLAMGALYDADYRAPWATAAALMTAVCAFFATGRFGGGGGGGGLEPVLLEDPGA